MTYLYDLYIDYYAETLIGVNRYNAKDYTNNFYNFVNDPFICDRNRKSSQISRYKNLLTLDYFCKVRIFQNEFYKT